MINRETASTVLTEKRQVLLDRIRDDEFDSVRHLAADIHRDKAAVSRDFELLFRYHLIEYRERDPGKPPNPNTTRSYSSRSYSSPIPNRLRAVQQRKEKITTSQHRYSRTIG